MNEIIRVRHTLTNISLDPPFELIIVQWVRLDARQQGRLNFEHRIHKAQLPILQDLNEPVLVPIRARQHLDQIDLGLLEAGAQPLLRLQLVHVLHAQKEERIVVAVPHERAQLIQRHDLVADGARRKQRNVGLDTVVLTLQVGQVVQGGLQAVDERLAGHEVEACVQRW